jgi:Ca2+-binding RTX toxin-like protein
MAMSTRARFITVVLASTVLVGAFLAAGAGSASGATRECFGRTPTIVGSARAEVLTGTAGADVIVGLGGADVIKGLGGRDRICGGDGKDQLLGGEGNDRIEGGEGINHYVGGPGNDLLSGRDGLDEADYSSAPHSVNVDLVRGVATGDGSDTLIRIENVQGSPFDDVITAEPPHVAVRAGENAREPGPGLPDPFALMNFLFGGGGNDQLSGGPGWDVLMGQDGDDVLLGGAGPDEFWPDSGDDRIDGGAGVDTLQAVYSEAVTVDLEGGTAVGDGTDTVIGIENVEGSHFDDTLIGDAGANSLHGGSGNDTISGGDGDDYLDGEEGDDGLDGGNGTDTIYGGPGTDTCTNGEDVTDCES